MRSTVIWACRTHARWALPLLAVVAGGCETSPTTLSNAGEGAQAITSFTLIMFGIALIVFVVVFGYFAFALFRRRRLNLDAPPGRTTPLTELFVIVTGGVVPTLVLALVFALSLNTLSSLASTPATPAPVVVEITGHQWWWEIRYPDLGVVTANEVHIPVGARVSVKATSADVIHSVWVPQLQGKFDAIPGQTNTGWLEAKTAGTYRGECAEYCGVEHALMDFVVVAESPAAFQSWIDDQKQQAAEMTTQSARLGEEVFSSSACVYCHSVRGTNALGVVGPDLTHLMSRQTIGAGALPLNRGTLAGWILDPQSIKPGNLMPPTHLSSQELNELLDYLETLR